MGLGKGPHKCVYMVMLFLNFKIQMFYTIGQNCSLAISNYSPTIVVSGDGKVVPGDFGNPTVASELGIHLVWVCSHFSR